MREIHRLTEFAVSLGRVALVTDGRFSGASSGLAVGYVCPEAWDGGPIGLVEDGDWVTIHIPNRRLELEVDEATLEVRRNKWKRPKKAAATSFLRDYRERVTSASQGALLRDKGVGE